MSSVVSDYRWGILLQSNGFDWRERFPPPFSPFVEEHEALKPWGSPAYVLRSKDLELLTTALEVRERAQVLVLELKGILALERKVFDLQVANVVDFNLGIPEGVHVFGSANQILEAPDTASFVVTRHGGTAQFIPAPSIQQRQANSPSDAIREALRHFARADNWHDLYKAFEAAENAAKGKVADFGMARKLASRINQTAQEFRHASHHAHRPEKPVSFLEAHGHVRDLIWNILNRGLPD